MKKLIALFITLIYLSMNACYALSELYYLKNTTENDIKPLVDSALSYYDFKIQNQNPYYATDSYDKDSYAVVILQQSGQNLFYFYKSNKNKSVNKKFLKSLEKQDIIYEQSFNANIINIYEGIAQKAINTGGQNSYIFAENYTPAYNNTSTQTSNSDTLRGYVAQISKGTTIPIYLQNAINTSSTTKGDKIVGVITADVKYNGVTVFPQGSIVNGTLTTARHASYGSRNGRVVIDFNQIVTPDNKIYSISTEEIDFTVTNDGKVARVAGEAVVGAIVGGLLGLLVGAVTDHHVGTAAAIGAGVGAGGALLSGTAERGIDAEIPSFTEMELTLTKPVNVTVNY